MLAERGPAAVERVADAVRPDHLDARGARSTPARATASSRTPSTGCSPTCATRTATCAGARSRRSTTASSRTPTRSPTATTRWSATAWRWTGCAATPARWSRPTCATSCPARWSSGCSTPSSATTTSPTAGSASRPASSASTGSSCTTSTRRSARPASVDYAEARGLIDASFGRFSPRVAELADGLLRGAPHRRRAARGQARRRLLRARRPGRVALRAHELHRPHGRRDDAGPRARPRHALHAGRRRADRALVRHRARARRGALDVRRAARLRPPDGGRGATRRRGGR